MPIKLFRRRLFKCLKRAAPESEAVLACYLSLEGLSGMNMFDSDFLSGGERQRLISSLLEIDG